MNHSYRLLLLFLILNLNLTLCNCLIANDKLLIVTKNLELLKVISNAFKLTVYEYLVLKEVDEYFF